LLNVFNVAARVCVCACAVAWSSVGPSARRGLGNSAHRVYARTWVSAVAALWMSARWRRVQPVNTNCPACSHSW